MELSLRARVRAGDPDAFGQLFDEHASVPGGDEESLRPWLLGIATNVTRNTTWAARRHQAALSRIPPPDPVPYFAEEVTQRLTDAEELAAAHRALYRLRRGEREVFARSACGRAWTRPRRPGPWAWPSAPYGPGSRGRGNGCAS